MDDASRWGNSSIIFGEVDNVLHSSSFSWFEMAVLAHAAFTR